MSAWEEWQAQAAAMHHVDPEAALPDALVTASGAAHWLDPAMTGNPSRIGALPEVPAATMEFYVQEIPPHSAGDLQRHRHESVHYVTAGSGYSEIGPRTVTWSKGDLVYTPPWVWHRHYNSGNETVEMLLVENSRLLAAMGLAERESAGEVTYAEHLRGSERAGASGMLGTGLSPRSPDRRLEP
jgi:gentisate 1,2-dioxygenase